MKVFNNYLYSLLVMATCLLSVETVVAACNPDIFISKPDSRYVDNGDETISDNTLGLMWQKCQYGLSGSLCEQGNVQVHTWQAALKIANSSTFAGYNDWRVPNIKELQSLVEVACRSPAVNKNFFPNIDLNYPAYIWSSTSTGVGTAMIGELIDGVDFIFEDMDETFKVMIVRDE